MAEKKQYERGKLYRIAEYPWDHFTLFTAYGVRDPAWGYGRYRKKLFERYNKGAIFLYLGYIPPEGTTQGLHHVICEDTVGAVDDRIVFERLPEEEDDNG